MPVRPEPTPNPNAVKFSVGRPVGGPSTHVAGKETDDPAAAEILALPEVVSVFMTADFVTVSKSSDGDWDSLIPRCVEILERTFD